MCIYQELSTLLSLVLAGFIVQNYTLKKVATLMYQYVNAELSLCLQSVQERMQNLTWIWDGMRTIVY